MKKSLLISEADNIAALLENDRVVEFFVNRGELLLGDVYTATVENILPGIDAAFVNLGKDKMGFLHANDVPGQGVLKEKLVPKQKLLVQITKEPTGHKGPRVSTAISLPGRFLVLVPEERGVSISRRIAEAKERARLKSVVSLMKPPGAGLIIRTEAKGQGEQELFEDFEQLWDRWQTIVSDGEASIGPTLIYRDQDLLYRVIRDAYSNDVNEIIVDSPDGQKRALDFMQGWASRNTKVLQHVGEEPLLLAKGIDREIESALSDRAELPSGGHLNIQPTEALTVIDVNSGRFTSSRTQAETVRRTNLEAAQEIPRQLRLRNIGGMVIVDFIDMESRRDQQQVLEQFQRALEDDRAKPQIGQLSDLGLVELTRRRQGQSLRELFTSHCGVCSGLGVIPSLELGFGEHRRALSFKSRDEDALMRGRRRGNNGNRQQGGQLKAATASGGRIKPIVAPEHNDVQHDALESHMDEEEFSAVPEDILSQVPEELLDNQRAFGKSGVADLGDDHDAEHGDDAHFGEEKRENAFNRGTLYSETSDSFEDDESASAAPQRNDRNDRDRDRNDRGRGDRGRDRNDRNDRSDRNDRNDRNDRGDRGFRNDRNDVSDRNDASRRTAQPQRFGLDFEADKEDDTEKEEQLTLKLAPKQFDAAPQPRSFDAAPQPRSYDAPQARSFEPAVTHEAIAVEIPVEVEPEPIVEIELPPSPFETEIDPVTGIYRLKARPAQEEGEERQEESSSAVATAESIELSVAAQEQPTWHQQEDQPQEEHHHEAPQESHHEAHQEEQSEGEHHHNGEGEHHHE